MPTQTLHINARPPSLNQMYGSGVKQRIQHKKAWKWEVVRAMNRHALKPVSAYPVTVRFSACFGPGERRLDSVNLAAAEKAVTDLMVAKYSILVNDSPKYIEAVTLGPCTRGKTTRCTYEIIEPETP